MRTPLTDRELRNLKSHVPCLAKAQRDYAAKVLRDTGSIYAAIVDIFDDDRQAYMDAIKGNRWFVLVWPAG